MAFEVRLRGYPFDSYGVKDPETGVVTGDRLAWARDYRDIWGTYFSDGIIVKGAATVSNELKVTKLSGLDVNVSPGVIHIDGGPAFADSDVVLTHEVGGDRARIDRIIVELCVPGRRECVIKILPGIPATSPVPPALVKTKDVYQLSLAQVRINAGMATIASVTDERSEKNVCGVSNVQVGVEIPTSSNAAAMALDADLADLYGLTSNKTVDGALRQLKKYTVVEFTTSQTWRIPKGVTHIDAFLCDGGYGGDGAASGYTGSDRQGASGGNGGRGAKCKMHWNVDIHQATSLDVVVGAGGPGGIGGARASGGSGSYNKPNNTSTRGGESTIKLIGTPHVINFDIEEVFGSEPISPGNKAAYKFKSGCMANDGDGKGYTRCPLNGKQYCPSGAPGGDSGSASGEYGGSGTSNSISGGRGGNGGRGGTNSTSIKWATDGGDGTAINAPTPSNNLYGAGGNGAGAGGSGMTEDRSGSGKGGNGSKGNAGIVVIGYWSA